MIVWIIGSVLLIICALSKSNAVLPANINELKISDDQAPLLLKSAAVSGADQSSIFNTPYKPYSIFGEQLSRITEEDASALDLVLTTENSLRQMYSYGSNVSSFYSRRILANEGLEYYRSQSTEREDIEEQQRTVHVYALSLLPLPTVIDPLVALLSSPEDEAADEELFPRPMYNDQPLANPLLLKSKSRRLQTLACTTLLLGVTKALLNTFLFVYIYHVLQIPLFDISFLIMAQIASESVVHFFIEKWFIHKLNLKFITISMHIALIFCSTTYLFLETGSLTTRSVLIFLQILQGIALQTIWSSVMDNIHRVVWSQYERMKERSKASALFSSCGPAIGTVIAGIVLNRGLENYHFLFKACVVFSISSFFVSLGWVTSD
ncbi:hypothetical protein BY458DRAFT_534337 [Sporodiniella umbellata]|nr:hypothetical protein BY458DRAFT_534337 [Sporodiniella umbellata]